MTYTQLRADIVAWTANESDELAQALDRIIRLGELRLARDADLRAFRQRQTVVTAIGNAVLAMPDDCLVVRQLRLTGGAALRLRPESFLREYWPDEAALGTPKYYAHRDAAYVLLAPTPNAASSVEVIFTALPTGLSPTVSDTWLSIHAYDALLASCLLEAATYLEGVTPERMAMYQQRYGEALTRLQGQESRTATDDYMMQGAD